MSGNQSKTADQEPRKKCPKFEARLPVITGGIEAGKSLRTIAGELGCNEGTVRRDLKKLNLPPEQLAAILEGESAEKYLNETLLRETGIDRSARNKLTRRQREEAKSGKHSDELSRGVLRWFATKGLSNANLETVLNHVKWKIEWLPDSQLASSSETIGDAVEPVERNPNVDRRLILPELDFLNRCASGLVIGLPRVEPLQAIRQSALEKAIRAVCARPRWTDRPEWQPEKANIGRRKDFRGGK